MYLFIRAAEQNKRIILFSVKSFGLLPGIFLVSDIEVTMTSRQVSLEVSYTSYQVLQHCLIT